MSAFSPYFAWKTYPSSLPKDEMSYVWGFTSAPPPPDAPEKNPYCYDAYGSHRKWFENPDGTKSSRFYGPGDIFYTSEDGSEVYYVECVENIKEGAGNFQTITSPSHYLYNKDERTMRFLGCDGPDDSVTAEFFHQGNKRVERGHPCATVGFFYANKNHGLFEGSLETLAKKMNGEIPSGGELVYFAYPLFRDESLPVLPKENERLLAELAKKYIHGAIVGGVQAGATMAIAQLLADARNSALMMLDVPPLPTPPPLS